jgi:opacity protein-like surface antigen
MKKILLLVAFAVASIAANAQSYVGGGINFSKQGDNFSFGIAPEIGTALNEKWGVGLAFNFAKQKNVDPTFAINPYVRYQALQVNRWNIFVDGGVFFSRANAADPTLGGDPTNEFGLNVAPGVAYNLTDKISIVAKAGNLLSLNFSKPGDDLCMNFMANTNNNFSFGGLTFGFYFNF